MRAEPRGAATGGRRPPPARRRGRRTRAGEDRQHATRQVEPGVAHAERRRAARRSGRCPRRSRHHPVLRASRARDRQPPRHGGRPAGRRGGRSRRPAVERSRVQPAQRGQRAGLERALEISWRTRACRRRAALAVTPASGPVRRADGLHVPTSCRGPRGRGSGSAARSRR